MEHPQAVMKDRGNVHAPPHSVRPDPGIGRGLGVLSCGVLLAICMAAPSAGAARAAAAAPSPYAPVLTGRAVAFGLSGFEPDFDPLYHVVIATTLHDRRPTGLALPDVQLILSSYLEVFQPDTTPVLPDLLHPDQTATSLTGFLQGKAALVNAAGRVAYRGSMLGEIFQNSVVHVVLRLDSSTASTSSSAAPLQLSGLFTLYKGGTQRGWLRTAGPLAPHARAVLAVPRGPSVAWQTVVQSLAVSPPRMMGTASNPGQHRPARTTSCSVGARTMFCAAQQNHRSVRPATRSTHAGRVTSDTRSRQTPRELSRGMAALGTALAGAVVALLLWWRLPRGKAPAGV